MIITVENRYTVQSVKCDKPHLFISVCDRPGRETRLNTSVNTVAAQYFFFPDIEHMAYEEGLLVSFNPIIAEDILDFVLGYKDEVQQIIVNCDAGLCRSPAIASVLDQMFNNTEGPWFSTCRPNVLVYECLKEVAMSRGFHNFVR